MAGDAILIKSFNKLHLTPFYKCVIPCVCVYSMCGPNKKSIVPISVGIVVYRSI